MESPAAPGQPVRGTIVTLGGGGFSMSDDGSSHIDDHLIELTGNRRPRVCFIPTASGDSPEYAERFESSSTDSFGPLAPLRDGLGFLPGSACPHYLGEAERRQQYLDWVAGGSLAEGYAVDEYAAIVWRDGQLVEALCEQPDRPVYRVHRDGGHAVEAPIPARLLT